MPSFNQARFIGAAIESVLSQSYGRVELLIGDGGSDDGTVDVLRAASDGDSRVRWRSGSDGGPANAINRCFAVAQGTIIGWLNSDDVYTPGAISRAVDVLVNDKTLAWCYGQGEHMDVQGAVLGRYPTRRPSVGAEGFQAGCFICQPTVFLRATTQLLLGDLDESYATAFDLDYWLRAFKAFPGRVGFVDAVQAKSRLHDACITMRARRTVALDGLRATHTHLGASSPHWAIAYLEDAGGADLEEVGAFIDDVRPYLTLEQMRQVEQCAVVRA